MSRPGTSWKARAAAALLDKDSFRSVAEAVLCFLGRRGLLGSIVDPMQHHVARACERRHDVRRLAVLANGAALAVDLRVPAGRWLYFHSGNWQRSFQYEPETTAFLRRWLRPGDTFVDVGANVGYFVALACEEVGESGRCVAVEPNPLWTPFLHASACMNCAEERVAIRSCALAEREGEQLLFVPDDLGLQDVASLVRDPAGGRTHEVATTTLTLDALLREEHVSATRLLKMDVEGAELLVLQGGGESLASGSIDALVIEFAPWLLDDPKGTWSEMSGLLSAHRYHPHEIGRGGSLVRCSEAPSERSQNVCFLRDDLGPSA